jgi:hypothetical protein
MPKQDQNSFQKINNRCFDNVIDALPEFMSPIDGFLLACSTFDKDSARTKIMKWLKLGLNWDSVLDRAAHHRLTPILYYHLSDPIFKDLVPLDVTSRLKNHYVASAADTMRKLAILEKILATFRESGIEPIVLKGPALARTLYPEIALRQFGDIDILIREEDWPGVRTGLMQLGFLPTGNDSPKLPPRLTKEIVFDHWFSFQNSGGIKIECKFDLLELGLRTKSLDGVWGHIISFSVVNQVAKKLLIEDEILMLCVHLNRHGFSRLSWFLDIAELLKKYQDLIDWEYLCAVAKKENVNTVMFHTLFYIKDLFDTPVSEKVMMQLKPTWIKSKIWRMSWPEQLIATFSGRRDEIITFYEKSLSSKWLIPNILLMGRAGEKIKYLIRRIVPPKNYLIERYPLDGRSDNRGYLRYLLERCRTPN